MLINKSKKYFSPIFLPFHNLHKVSTVAIGVDYLELINYISEVDFTSSIAKEEGKNQLKTQHS